MLFLSKVYRLKVKIDKILNEVWTNLLKLDMVNLFIKRGVKEWNLLHYIISTSF